MNSVDNAKDASSAPTSSPTELLAKLAYATPETAPLVPGRREFFKYRDLGVTDATGGRMRAQITIATGDMQETGWHYHLCESQFIFTLRGWVDLLIEDGRKIRLSAGESLHIPGGLKHNEIAISEDFELLEVSVPAKMGSVACDPPEAFLSK
jgi:quercetin dioxygenase-like cupin family protein